MTGRQMGMVAGLVLLAGMLGGAVALLATGATGVSAQPDGEVVTARALQLVDDDGNVRGLMTLTGSGQPYLSFYDHDGKERISLYLTGAGKPNISVFDANEAERASMYLDGSDQPTVGIYDQQERYRGGMFLSGEGWPHITIQDANRLRAGMYLRGDGSPRLTLDDANGATRQVLGVLDDGTGVQAFLDENGNIIAVDPRGSALFGPLP